ncbi:MAG: hypothetical protein ACJ79S_09705 [Gemmatimonadaceae bacterium]
MLELATRARRMDAAIAEEVADLEALAASLAIEAVSEYDARYLAQRAYDANRGKAAYGPKLARGRRGAESVS